MAVASLLLMVTTSGAFVLIHQRSDARIAVLVVARPVTAGQTLVTQDLRVVSAVLDPAFGAVRADQAASVVGHTAAVPLVVGTLLSPNQIGPAAWPTDGYVVVAVPVKTSRLAEGVTAGSHVLVVQVAKDAAGTQASSATSAVQVSGVVVSVHSGTDASGTSVVSLLLPRQDAVTIAATGAELSVALAQG